MKIIITGATGFVGKNLSHYLENLYFQVEKLSLREDNWQLETANTLIHLAGKAHDTANTYAEEEYYQVNTELTQHLFDAFLDSDIQDFIYFSSVKAAADTLEGILDETYPANPQTPYGKSKLKAEDYLLSKPLPEGKRLFIIRPCMIHGEGNKGNLNLLYKVVEKGIPWFLASFENKRSFLSIHNLCYLISKILSDRTVPSGIYNFADDEPMSTNQLIGLMSQTLGKKPKLWYWSASLITKMAKIGDALSLPLNSERLKKLTESYVVSNQKIKAALEIEKLPLTAEEGLELTIQSFRK